jgi:rhodanese-related sulfurtransferase
MTKGAMDLVREAKQRVENLTPEQVAAEVEGGDAMLVDVREPKEREETGVIPGAISAPRGMLEFYADPSLPYHMEGFDRDRRIIVHCGSGGRSALAAATLKELGYRNVAHLDGGMNAWQESGRAVDPEREQ